jgi:hypothetical protein
MSQAEPWHSLRENVHHNHAECAKGKSIEPGSLRKGTGTKPLCRECHALGAGGETEDDDS